MESTIFTILITTGFIFMLAGFVMYKFPPKKINSLYGYRTPSSMKNQERWNFAQKYSAKLMIKLGSILVLCSTLSFVFKPTENIETLIGIIILLSFVGILFFKVEAKIKKHFSKENL